MLGFTIVELIVVIVILAILATIGFLNFKDYPKQARDTTRISDFTNIRKAMDIYYLHHGLYPTPTNTKESATYTGWLEGELDESVTSKLGLSNIKDPQTKEKYKIYLSNDSTMFLMKIKKETGGELSLGGLPKSCKDLRQANSRLEDGKYIIFFEDKPREVYCDMTTDGGGWELIIDKNTNISQLAKIGDTSNISSTFYNDPNYGIGWGTNDSVMKSFMINKKHSEILVEFTGFYDNPSEGLGHLIIQSDSNIILKLDDSWTRWQNGQDLKILDKYVFREKRIDIINRKETIKIKGNKLTIGMVGRSGFPYTKRYISKFYIR